MIAPNGEILAFHNYSMQLRRALAHSRAPKIGGAERTLHLGFRRDLFAGSETSLNFKRTCAFASTQPPNEARNCDPQASDPQLASAGDHRAIVGVVDARRSKPCQGGRRSRLVAALGGRRGSTTGDEPVRRAALAYRLGGRDDLSRTMDLAEDRARRAVL